jgi:hypothetical protein
MRAKKEGSTFRRNGNDKTDNQNTIAAEQRKGFEYEVDMVMAISAEHYGNVIKDRTGKFQDEITHKPGVDFGKKLAEWLKDGAVPMDKQIQTVLSEIGNIIKSKSEKDEPYFTTQEYESIKAMCKDSMSKSQDERLEFLQKVLSEQKKLLHDRVGGQLAPSNNSQQQEPSKETTAPVKPSQDNKPSLAEDFKKHMAEKNSQNASPTPLVNTPEIAKPAEIQASQGVQATATSMSESEGDGFEDDIPEEEREPVMAGAESELDIF